MRTPLNFKVIYPEANYSWERAKLFFERYTSKYGETLGTSQQPNTAGGEIILSNGGAEGDPYFYQVRRLPLPGGFSYLVACRPRLKSATQGYADRNARNLARFILEGKLEVSLLKR